MVGGTTDTEGGWWRCGGGVEDWVSDVEGLGSDTETYRRGWGSDGV